VIGIAEHSVVWGSGAEARDGEGADFPGLKAGAFTVVLLRSTLGAKRASALGP